MVEGWKNFQGFVVDPELCEGPADGEEGEPDAGACPGCETFIFSEADETAIETCLSADGDGVITFPGDCAGFPDFCTPMCENWYGDFRFGLNATHEGTFSSPKPFYWETDETWIHPAGTVTCNSACPGVLSQHFVFDTGLFEQQVEAGPTFTNQTPGTVVDTLEANNTHNAGIDGKHQFQLAVCDPDINCEAAACLVPPDPPLNNGMGIAVEARFVSDGPNPGIAGVAWLQNDGSTPTISGYGLLFDRVNDKTQLVAWSDALFADYTIIAENDFVPTGGDFGSFIYLELQLLCGCSGFEPEISRELAPTHGKIFAQAGTGPGSFFHISDLGFIDRGIFEGMTHAALVVLPTGTESCNEQSMTFRRVHCLFGRATSTCS